MRSPKPTSRVTRCVEGDSHHRMVRGLEAAHGFALREGNRLYLLGAPNLATDARKHAAAIHKAIRYMAAKSPND